MILRFCRKTAVAFALCVSMMFPMCAEAAKSVSQLKNELQAAQSNRSKAANQRKSKEKELDGVLAKKNEIEEEMSAIEEDIDSIDAVISEKENEIKQKQEEIEQYTELIDTNDRKFKQRLKVMYESGTTTYLEMLLEAKGLSDLFTRIAVVRDIAEHDKNLINSYVDARTGVENAKTIIETEKSEKEEARTILSGKRTELAKKKAEKDELMADLQYDIDELKRLEEQGEKQEEIVKQELAAALAAQEKASSKSGASTAPAPARLSSGQFCWPSASSTRVTSDYGTRVHPITKTTKFHKGIDIGAAQGTNVLAAADGTVVTAGWNSGGYGYYITINHGGGVVTLYGHNSKLLVKAGDTVKKGQVIAKVGSTGNSTGPHIHFEVLVNGSVVNPYNYL